VWQYGAYASRGVKEVCELGYPRTVEDEIQQRVRFTPCILQCNRSRILSSILYASVSMSGIRELKVTAHMPTRCRSDATSVGWWARNADADATISIGIGSYEISPTQSELSFARPPPDADATLQLTTGSKIVRTANSN
jgi:hypothetical protein